MYQHYRTGNWVVLGERLIDGSEVFHICTVETIPGSKIRIDAVNLDAAIQIADCLALNAV